MEQGQEYHKFKEGDIVRVKSYYTGDDANAGDILTFIHEDGSSCPRFQKSDGNTMYFYNRDLELVSDIEPSYSIF